ncbi:MAG: hypothetical protein ACYTF9_16290 [Planctomycetota bacterium]|jgi:hypothetical protein
MGLLTTNKKKLLAAARSMHQFCSPVRALYPNQVTDSLIESATVFLYLRAANNCFNRKFAVQLGGEIASTLKYASSQQLREVVGRLAQQAAAFEQSADMLLGGAAETNYAHQVRSLMRALFAEGGEGKNDAELVARSFVAFDGLLKQMEAHLQGIKKQNPAMFR